MGSRHEVAEGLGEAKRELGAEGPGGMDQEQVPVARLFDVRRR